MNKKTALIWVWIVLGISGFTLPVRGELNPSLPREGQVRFETSGDEQEVAARFRLPPHTFSYREEAAPDVAKRVSISRITFPSPVETTSERNNTVHCEYYRPRRQGKVPGVIVLHILGGDFPLARVFANMFAEHGVAALFVKMPYYGERRDPANPRRMISDNPVETVEGMTQAILDIRHAAAFLASREEIDSSELGIFGISLGGITGALAATAEPKLQNVCLLLAGGDIGAVAWEARELDKIRRKWIERGRTKEEFLALMKNVDPVEYGHNARGRRILMLNAKQDELIPRACTDALWNSFGQPEIVWYEGTHYTVIWHLLHALHRTATFFENSAHPAGGPP